MSYPQPTDDADILTFQARLIEVLNAPPLPWWQQALLIPGAMLLLALARVRDWMVGKSRGESR